MTTQTTKQEEAQSFKDALNDVVNYKIYIISWSPNIQHIKVMARTETFRQAYKILEALKVQHPQHDLRVMQEIRKHDI